MTKEEAIKAMQTHRVRHSSWGKNEWCQVKILPKGTLIQL